MITGARSARFGGSDTPGARRPRGPAAPSPAAGWAALSQARWEQARRLFAAALAHEETAEALEGLSWASWWLDAGDAALAAREGAFSLYRRQGDRGGAIRMAAWLAADHIDFRGAFAVASGWFQRARRLARTIPPGVDHGWLDFHEGYIAFRQGDPDRSTALARRTSRLGRRFDVPDLEMLGLALEGGVLVACAQTRRGMQRLDEATAIALEADAAIPISRAWVCCFLVAACEAVRDYRRAFEWCDRIAEFAEHYDSDYMRGFCRHHYAAVHMWRGAWTDAEREFEAAAAAYARSRPAYVSAATAGLAELRRRQGRCEDAERLLGQAAALVCRSRLALDRGDPRQALDLAERALRQTSASMVVGRAPALEVVIEASAAVGGIERSRTALTELKRVVRSADTLPLRAAVHLAEAIVAVANGEHERARPLLQDAADEFERSEAPFECVQVRLRLAHCLTALGRRDEAASEAHASLARLDALGAAAAAGRARALLDVAPRSSSDLPQVTPRERDVLRCLAEGITNRQIADRLFISEHTVHRHVTSILRKLDLPTRTAAAAHAVRAGVLE
jgi:LuxR family transcriptional regulator, maltose regulon positive regulatory protein